MTVQCLGPYNRNQELGPKNVYVYHETWEEKGGLKIAVSLLIKLR